MNLYILIIDTNNKIKDNKEKISNLYKSFDQCRTVKYRDWAHEITFGFLVSEYVLKLNIASKDDNLDAVLLLARRLLEVFIVTEYIVTTNQFDVMIDFCVYDRHEYLKGCMARGVADEKLFPELVGLDNYLSDFQKQEKELFSQHGSGKKMLPIRKMAERIDYLDEYNYFYKFTSKLLHFCPFSLNGDADFNRPLDKVVFLCRVAKYIEKIRYELENIYQRIPKI
ncbi:DUF5677 domain-containing protein [Candidatus Ruminimicrobiellum ovillum]|uniref:DUF5677 domain-containing protein n=1 Tax=Candidatus Ruminimicrobiellum ovillum TaxID=1947927 RepID=UPI00355AA203